jgi:hypothetical protein
MPRSNTSRGSSLTKQLKTAVREEQNVLSPGARDLKILHGVDSRGVCDRPLENVLHDFTNFLVESERIYRYGNNVVMEKGREQQGKLITLSLDSTLHVGACAQLANLVVCEKSTGKEQDRVCQFAPPQQLVNTLLSREATVDELPEIKIYARRPIFDAGFRLCSGGYDPQSGILVHADLLEPAELPTPDPTAGIFDRLPPHLSQLLSDFCFREPADLANAVAVLLTGLLVNHFVPTGKPLDLLDGNQPGVGKTLLARVISMVLDGEDSRLVSYTCDDEELAKKLCATLQSSQRSTVVIDNARVRAGHSVGMRRCRKSGYFVTCQSLNRPVFGTFFSHSCWCRPIISPLFLSVFRVA